jgi:hypothetical protein
MFLVSSEKLAIKRQAWLDAARYCGGTTALAKSINVLRSRVSNWVNQPELEIPYQYVILTSFITKVSIDRLSPFTESANKIISELNMDAEKWRNFQNRSNHMIN